MMDFDERVIPGVTANFQYKESLARYEFARRNLKKEARVLDIGCGTGYGSAVLAENYEVIALDNDKEAIRYAKKHYKKPLFKTGNAEKLKFDDSSFDAVVAFELIEHLKNPQKFLSEVKRVLRRNGVFILSTPNKNFPKIAQSSYHIKEYGFDDIHHLLKKYFRTIKLYGQSKSKRAREAHKEFLASQGTRQSIVDVDKFGLRKLFPKRFKEWIWKYLGFFFGRQTQESLATKDFPIGKKINQNTEYFIGLCQK